MRQLVIFTLCLFTAACFSSCDDEDLYIGTSTIITEERFMPFFDGLNVSDVVDVTISYGTEASVLLTANENIMDRIRTVVNNEILEVRLLRGNYRDVDISLEIVVTELSYLKASDDASITAATFLDLDNLRLEASDGSYIAVEGTSDDLFVRCSDGAEIKAFNLTALRCDARVTDGADLEVYVTEELSGRVSDGGDLFYRGNPAIDVATSDGGELINAN